MVIALGQARGGLAGLGQAKPAAGGANWWEAGGATGVIAAYQPKGAASYAASKVNLANPGTHDATDGGNGPIGWNTSLGWLGSIADALYLETDIVFDENTSALAQFNNASISGLRGILGSIDGGYIAGFINANNGGGLTYWHSNGQDFNPELASGNMAVTDRGYRNGVQEGVSLDTTGANAQPIWIGGFNNNGGIAFATDAEIVAVVFYNSLLDGTTVTALEAAMAAL